MWMLNEKAERKFLKIPCFIQFLDVLKYSYLYKELFKELKF